MRVGQPYWATGEILYKQECSAGDELQVAGKPNDLEHSDGRNGVGRKGSKIAGRLARLSSRKRNGGGGAGGVASRQGGKRLRGGG